MTTLTLTAGGIVALPAIRRPARTARADAAARPSGLHLTRRGRLVVLLLAVTIVLGATFAATRADAGGPVSAPVVERYVVAPGDTLWEIAVGLAKPGEDLRDVVREVQLLNRLPSAGLTAGQAILLPVGR